MRNLLESRIAALRGRVRRLLALHGTSWVVGAVLLAVMVAGLADWSIHLVAEVRLVLLLGIVGLAAWTTARFVIRPLVIRFRDLDIALRIEKRWPGLNDRLASTIQFLKETGEDERLGSRALREATVQQTLRETAEINFAEVIDSRPVRQALTLGLGAVVLGLAAVVAAPQLSAIAVHRLFFPFGSARWPQRTHLILTEAPRKVAQGDPFTLVVKVREGDSIPSSARATYRFASGQSIVESLRSVEGGSFRGRIESVSQPFTFSVAAGDDATAWRKVAVVPPPLLTTATARLDFPAYTGLASQSFPLGPNPIKAVEGTQLTIHARANKPLKSATLHHGEGSDARPVPADLDSDGIRLTARFPVAHTGSFWFALRDREDFGSREAVRYELRAIKDEPPRVVIEEPATDREVPARATVPLEIDVDDDYGIQVVRLVYKVAAGSPEPAPEVVVPLWEPGAAGTKIARQTVKHREVAYRWDLAPLKLPPGALITFHADARDFDSIHGPKLGKSRELRIRIISDEEANRQLEDDRRAIREETARIHAMQKQAQVPVKDARRILSQVDRLAQQPLDSLKNGEMVQRQVSGRVTSRTDGLEPLIKRFLANLDDFKINNPDAKQQMTELKEAVDRIRDQHLNPAEQGLTRALKGLDNPAGQPSNPQAAQPSPARADAQSQQQQQQRGGPQDNAAAKAAQEKAAGASERNASKAAPADSNSTPGESSKGAPSGDQAQEKAAGDQSQQKGSPSAPDQKQPANPSKAEAPKLALADAEKHQDAIVSELEKMLENLGKFETYRGVVKDAQNLLKEHEEAMKKTAEMAARPDLVGKNPEELKPEDKADLANLGARQAEVGKGVQNLSGKMGEMAQRLDQTDPLAAEALREAAQQVQKQGTAAKLDEAAGQLEKNQIGPARTGQEQARRDLRNLVDTLQNRRDHELSHLIKELKDAEAELNKLSRRQAENLRKTAEARKNANAKERANQLRELAKEQAEIQKELDSQLKRLRKLRAEAAAAAAAKAAGRMAKAQQDLDQGEGEQAEKDEDEVLNDLEQARKETEQARKDAEEQLAMELLARIDDEIKSLGQRQAKVIEQTKDYDTTRAGKQGRLTPAQRLGIRNLGLVQQGLKDETAELVEKLEGAPVFALILKRAAAAMDTAAGELQELKTGEPTQTAERQAAKRFQQLLDALKPDPAKGGGGGQGGQGGGQGGGGGGGNDDRIPAAAQIKMLKWLQEEINERTEALDELRNRGQELTPDQLKELDKLHDDQRTVGDLARDLTRPRHDDGEE